MHDHRRRTRRASAALVAIAALAPMAGCSGTTGLDRQREWVDLNPHAPEQVRRAVLGKRLIPGMGESAIVASWGEPDGTLRLGSSDTRWTYLRPQYGDGVKYNVEYTLVLRGGVLVSVQQQIRR